MNVGLYAKAIAGSAVAGLTAALTALDDGAITGAEWTGIIATVLVAAGAVWAVPNLHVGVARYGKAATSAVVAGLGASGTALTDGTITQAEWVAVAIAVFGGAGVTYTVPNSKHSDGYL